MPHAQRLHFAALHMPVRDLHFKSFAGVSVATALRRISRRRPQVTQYKGLATNQELPKVLSISSNWDDSALESAKQTRPMSAHDGQCMVTFKWLPSASIAAPTVKRCCPRSCESGSCPREPLGSGFKAHEGTTGLSTSLNKWGFP